MLQIIKAYDIPPRLMDAIGITRKHELMSFPLKMKQNSSKSPRACYNSLLMHLVRGRFNSYEQRLWTQPSHYRLPDKETKLQFEEVHIYVARFLRSVKILLLRTFRNGFHHVLDNSKRAKKIDKRKSLTVNYYKTGTLQLQGNNAQSGKDKLRAAMDGGQTNCDVNDESGDVVSDRHVAVDNEKSQVDTPELSETSSNETDHFIKHISPHSLDVNIRV